MEKAEASADVYRQADFLTVHLPKTAETRGWLDAEAFAQMKDGVRVINCARGELVVDEALKDALDSGKVAGAALDVFPSEPIIDYPLFSGYDNVVVTPHLGASTTEAQDRAGVQTAEQVVAALTGGVVSTAVNIPADLRRGHGGAGAVPAPRRPARAPRHGPGRGHRRGSRRGRVLRPHRRARHPAAHPRGGPRRARRPHGGGGQPRQRALAGRGARYPDLRADATRRRATSPTCCASAWSPAACAPAWSARRSAGATARTCSRRGATASTCSSTRAPTSPCSATSTCPA